MNTATVIALLKALLGLVPQIPELVSGVKTAIGLMESGKAPSPEEQAAIDAALEKAHAQLQAS